MSNQKQSAGDYLREMGIKPSFQRLKIFEYLAEYHIHPTVEDIHQTLVPDIPTLSKTTVYNTLGLFSEKGLLKQVNLGDGQLRYDINLSSHGHFICKHCKEITDFPVDYQEIIKNSLEGYHIDESVLVFEGVCKKCQSIKQ